MSLAIIELNRVNILLRRCSNRPNTNIIKGHFFPFNISTVLALTCLVSLGKSWFDNRVHNPRRQQKCYKKYLNHLAAQRQSSVGMLQYIFQKNTYRQETLIRLRIIIKSNEAKKMTSIETERSNKTTARRM